ncbi:MAG: hypothetical protein CK539_03135 [Flavobacteriales bacterium]|nr:MAG: hypothetical protein CK539_03135 [Flavobacteriales bacterium]
MITRLFFAISFLLMTIYATAQPAIAWERRYNGTPDLSDEAVSIAVDAAGNSYVTGSAFAPNGTLDIVTIKYSPGGQQMWLESYNGTGNGNDQGAELVLDNAGNVYVTGYSNNLNSFNDVTTIKYNNSGVLQWVSFHNGSSNNYDQGNALQVDANGNVYVVGYETTSNYTYDFVTIKYNSLGIQQWLQTYNGPGNFNDEGKDIGIDANGNVYVTGYSDTLVNTQPNEDIVLLKYNNSGAFQWRKVYDGPGHSYEWSKKLTIDRNNNILVVGYGWTASANGNDYIILKWSPSGNFQWIRSYNYGTNTFENPADIITDSLNNVIVTGQGITSSSSATNDYLTVKYNSSGTFQWASRYNGPANNDDRGTALALDDSLNIFVTGFSKGTGTLYDCATVKYDPSGNQIYALRYNNANANKDDMGNAIAVRNGDIYVTGKSANLSNDDYITLRYSYSAVGIAENGFEIENLLYIYPNPSKGENISVLFPENLSLKDANCSINITNAQGQIIRTENYKITLPPDTKNTISIPISDLKSGLYLLNISANELFVGSSKFVIE